MADGVKLKLVKPDDSLSDFVYSFSSLENVSEVKDGVIIPNGRVDLIFSKSVDGRFQIALIGLETKPKLLPKQNVSFFFAVSFNPLAIEYVFRRSIAGIVDKGWILPDDFWNFGITDLGDFNVFREKISDKIRSLLPEEIDPCKKKLFDLIFSADGEITIASLSEELHWSGRQMNRYFNGQFGLSLKSYCKILRFQASLPHIKAGKLFPQLNFTDQSHFIKDVKRLSGASPRELSKNQDDRFLQFLALGDD